MNLVQVLVEPIYKDINELVSSLVEKIGCSINPCSVAVINNSVSELCNERQLARLTLVTPKEMGFNDYANRENFLEFAKGRGLKNHTVEIYLRYVLQCHEQIEENNFLLFAMDPVLGSDNHLYTLGVCRLGGELIIFCSSIYKEQKIHSAREWLF